MCKPFPFFFYKRYNGDLAKIAKEVLKHKNIAKAKGKKYMAAKGKAEAAKALAKAKNKSWQKAKNKLKMKIKVLHISYVM